MEVVGRKGLGRLGSHEDQAQVFKPRRQVQLMSGNALSKSSHGTKWDNWKGAVAVYAAAGHGAVRCGVGRWGGDAATGTQERRRGSVVRRSQRRVSAPGVPAGERQALRQRCPAINEWR